MKRIAGAALCLILAIGLAGCGKPHTTASGEQAALHTESAMPEDFSFSLTWGYCGVSSYDSADGRLVKTWDAARPEDYETSHALSEEEKAYVYGLLSALDLDAYPAVYDPNEGMGSAPPMTLILTVRGNGTEKTVRTTCSYFF